MIKRIFYWLRSFRKIKTIDIAKNMKLKHIRNVYGDEINIANCRSYWEDEFGNYYSCSELYYER